MRVLLGVNYGLLAVLMFTCACCQQETRGREAKSASLSPVALLRDRDGYAVAFNAQVKDAKSAQFRLHGILLTMVQPANGEPLAWIIVARTRKPDDTRVDFDTFDTIRYVQVRDGANAITADVQKASIEWRKNRTQDATRFETITTMLETGVPSVGMSLIDVMNIFTTDLMLVSAGDGSRAITGQLLIGYRDGVTAWLMLEFVEVPEDIESAKLNSIICEFQRD